MYKNTAAQKIIVYAYDTVAEAPKTGDAANITAYLSKEGASGVVTNDTNPTELDATNMKGLYVFNTTQAETNADLVALFATSATANIVLEPVMIYTVDGASVSSILSDTTTLVDSNLVLSRSSGTIVADGSEQTVYENASPSGNWIADTVAIDITQMFTDTSIAVKVYYKIKSGGAYVKFDTQNYSSSQVNSLNEPGIVIRGIPNRYGYKVTLHQWAGISKTYDWERFSNG